MKMAVAADATLDTIGVEDEVEVTIKSSGKAFRMLIDGMYSDVFKAIAQEITANAADSHIMVGNKNPFFVHCPNDLRPEFFVRDYGEGMDHRKVMDLYSVLFESDKDDSDDVTGAFGLGKATPLAYSDQFSLSCYDGAEVRHYGCAIGVGGRPKIMLMGREACDEPRGVRVTLAVEEKDFAAFKTAIQTVAIAHPIPFESNIPLDTLEPAEFSGADWMSTETKLPSTWAVRQGCVIYPLKQQSGLMLPSDYNGSRIGSSNRNWLIEAEMGSIAITGSRESIKYSEGVVAYLNERITRIKAEAEAQARARVKGIKDLVRFHETWKKLRPGFVPEAIEHPITGMTGTAVHFPKGSLHLSTKLDDHTKRWTFKTVGYLSADSYRPAVEPNAEGKGGMPRKGAGTMFWIEDIEPLLDPTRESDVVEFTKSETRRISRLTRAFLEKRGLTSGEFLLGPNLEDKSWACCFPSVERVTVPYEDLRDAAPKRLQPKVLDEDLPPIRGLGLALKAGDQMPVSRVDLQDGDAWIESDVYRRKTGDLFALCRRFGVKRLYLASPTATAQVVEAGVPHVRDAIDANVRPWGLTWSDLQFFKSEVSDANNMGPFLARLHAKAPEVYDRFERAKNPYSVMARLLRPFYINGLSEFSDSEKKTMEHIDTPEGSNRTSYPPATQRYKDFSKAQAPTKSQWSHPMTQFTRNVTAATKVEQMTAVVDGLLALIKIIPLSLKF